jgi:translation initiation factor eIF-2B subunit gamma
MVGDSTQIEERATIKDSIVGRHCTIGKMAKIVKCVILDHCVIEEGWVPVRRCLDGMH